MTTWGAIGTFPLGSGPVCGPFSDPSYAEASGEVESAWILHGVLSDLATLSTPGNVALMPVTNLQTRDPTKKYRANGRVTRILIDCGGPRLLNAASWIGHRHSRGGSLRMRASNALDGGVITTALAAIDTNYHSVWPIGIKPKLKDWSVWVSILRWTNMRRYRYYQLDVGDDGAGITNTEAGRLQVGYAWQTLNGPEVGGTFGVTNNDYRNRSSWNKIQTSRRLPGRTLSMPFEAADEDEAVDQALELQRSLGTAKDLTVCLDPSETERFHYKTIYGTLMETGEFQPLAVWGPRGRQWSFELKVEELT